MKRYLVFRGGYQTGGYVIARDEIAAWGIAIQQYGESEWPNISVELAQEANA